MSNEPSTEIKNKKKTPTAKLSQIYSANRAVIFLNGLFIFILGWIQVIPLLIDLNGGHYWGGFASSAGISITIGGGLMLSSPIRPTELDLRHALGLTVTVWLVLAAFAAIPFSLSALNLSPTDAFFESMSGLTTTGATVISGLDDASAGLLIWRAILQWIGGIGIILTAIAILPALGIGGMQIFLAQQTANEDKVLTRASDMAVGIITIYVVLTLACAMAYNGAGMSRLDSWAHAMTTIASGGFSTHDASAGHFDSLLIHWLMIVFMILACLPYGVLLMGIHVSPKSIFRDEQIRAFITLWALLVAFISIIYFSDTYYPSTSHSDSMEVMRQGFRDFTNAAFSVTAVVTTTGYATTDYSEWSTTATIAFFFIGFVGGCAGSGTCALKIFRVHILAKAWWRQIKLLQRPHSVIPLNYNGKIVDATALGGISHYVCLFVLTIAAGAVALTAMGLDFISAVSGAAAAVTNVGPGLGATIGPAGTYGSLPDNAKWLISFLMLLGRLELVTLLLLITPRFWRRYGKSLPVL